MFLVGNSGNIKLLLEEYIDGEYSREFAKEVERIMKEYSIEDIGLTDDHTKFIFCNDLHNLSLYCFGKHK